MRFNDKTVCSHPDLHAVDILGQDCADLPFGLRNKAGTLFVLIALSPSGVFAGGRQVLMRK